jgi:hypothetical protein
MEVFKGDTGNLSRCDTITLRAKYIDMLGTTSV